MERYCLHLVASGCSCDVAEMGNVLGLCSMASWVRRFLVTFRVLSIGGEGEGNPSRAGCSASVTWYPTQQGVPAVPIFSLSPVVTPTQL